MGHQNILPREARGNSDKTWGKGITFFNMLRDWELHRGGHTSLCFVTTCDNGVFNGGIFMHLSIFFPALFVDIKLL
jgi:hypothetical protein